MTVLDRVARAIFEVEYPSGEAGEYRWERSRSCYMDQARAAVEAMRVPPDGLRFAVGEWLEREGLSMDVSSADVWRLGIDVILAEK